MDAPQIVVIVLWSIAVGAHMMMDGKPKLRPDGTPDRYSFGRSLIQVSIWALLLWWGGFFS